ncbi:polysaccharide biosynthesis tyrosine autokinase [Clostridium saudiense]|uniref:polysaccharide biosynthesis tyrosine autokinase n=1 Tax=Clostridium saudiense TaxID=1414720 RepID=UPI000822ADB4|nr:polysaccharide biosynthesis tyrosine autokinase [Clostridium saudiense]MDU7453383.1 AAA family ATPase [Clostridium saudiense]SCJ84151.1 Tyrosine-protein kinase YwqD [uncultured Clostridium sp.]
MEKEVVLFQDIVRGTFKRWKLILAICICVLLLGGLISFNATSSEKSTGTVKLYINENYRQEQLTNTTNTNGIMIPTYIEFIKTREFLNEVIKETNSNIKYEQLLPNLLVTTITNTNYINIQYTGVDSKNVEEVLSVIVDNFINKVNKFESDITVDVVDKVNVTTIIESTNVAKIIILAAIGGLILGVGLAFVLECINRTYRTKGEMERDLEINAFGVIPKRKNNKNISLINLSSNNIEREAYNSIIVKMRRLNKEQSVKTFMVSSSLKGEGVTTVASNLALALSNVNSKVLLIDANFKYSDINNVFNISNKAGLNDVITNNRKVEEVISNYSNSLDILLSGTKIENQFEAFEKYDINKLLLELKEKYDVVIIDTESIQSSPVTQLLTTIVDGVIVVVGAEKVNKQSVKNTLSSIAELGGRIVGVILNSADTFRNKI